MDEDTAELVNQLSTRAGMIMEDVSDLALTIGGVDPPERSERLRRLVQAADHINRLVQAALVLEAR